jgi:predicted Zn-dependent protease
VKVFASKKAAFQNRKADEVLPDFSRASPLQKVLAPLPATAASVWSDWTERARQLSGVFLSHPGIQSSEVNVVEERGRRYYVNSEGFRLVTPLGVSGMRVIADTQAADGTPVRDNFEILERSLQDLPATPDLVARAREFAARMTTTQAAALGEEYTGPVLFEPRAGAELARQVLVPALLGTRSPDSERATQGSVPQFLSRIGSRVMAEELSVTDTPSLARFGARPVGGAYELDDEGIPAQDVPLVDKGKLLTLLTSRVPLRGLPQSNGHGRGGSVQPGVVQIASSAAVPAAQLKTTYLDLLKKEGRPFGYIVRTVQSPQFVKVTPDGKEEVVRGVRIASLATNMFRDVLGASSERELVTWRLRQSLASVIAPAFIIDDLEIQRQRDVAQKPPVVPSPLQR